MKTANSTMMHLTTIVILVFMMAVLPAELVRAQDTQLSDVEADALIADIEAETAEAERALRELASVQFYMADIIRDAGANPRALRDWVAVKTRWVPYTGALRGAEGVLMDAQGSSLDRALLLAELLTVAGHDARLARTSLPPDLSERFAVQALERPSTDMTGEIAHETRERRELVIAAADELGRLLDLDEHAPTGLAPSAADAMADHWWVLVRDGEHVIDLDVVFGEEDDDRPEATSVMAMDALPERMRHTVTMRVVIERLDADRMAEETVLEQRIPLGGPAHGSVNLWFIPAPGQGQEPDGDLGILDIAAFQYWRPVIEIDGEQRSGEWFDVQGRLKGPDQLAVGEVLGDASAALGALGAEESAGTGSRLTGVWIEYTSEGPGRAPRVERRELYDPIAALRGEDVDVALDLVDETLSDTSQAGLALLGDTSILVTGATFDEATLLEALYQDIIDSRSGRIALVFVAAGRDDERIAPSIAQTKPRPIPMMVMSLLRNWWSADPGQTFVDEPTVLSMHAVVPPDGALEGTSIISDVVLNHVGVLAGGQDAGRIRMRQGMLDTLIESELADDGFMPNVWDRFAGSVNTDTWLALNSATALDAIAPSIPDGDRVRIYRDLIEGRLVAIAPSASEWAGVEYSDWWRVDPDGSTLGMGFRGWGAQVIERLGTRKSGESLAANNARMQAIRICQRFGLAATALNVYLIQLELHRGRGLRPPRPPRGVTARYRCPVHLL